jgi:hypothetical protein
MLPKALSPTTIETFRISSSRSILVPKAVPTLQLWQGAPLADTYGGTRPPTPGCRRDLGPGIGELWGEHR